MADFDPRNADYPTVRYTASAALMLDTRPPALSQFAPSLGTPNLAATNTGFTITFNEAITKGQGLVTLKGWGGITIETFNVASSGQVTVNGNTLSVAPTRDLLPNSYYYLSINPGVVQDLSGNSSMGSYQYGIKTGAGPATSTGAGAAGNSTTVSGVPVSLASLLAGLSGGSAVDTKAPTITKFGPAPSAAGAALESNITLNFSEPVLRGTGTLTLKTAAGVVVETFDVAGSDRITVAGSTVTIDPSVALLHGTSYYFALESGSFQDLAFNRYASSGPYLFKTVLENVPPTVVTWSPADGAANAAPDANITLTFSEAIARGTGTVILKTAAGTVIETFNAATSPRLRLSGDTLTVDPTLPLPYDTSYYLVFGAGNVKDLAGNSYAGTSQYDFKTLPDTTGPVVTKFSPTDAAINVARNANIVLTFDEPIVRGSGKLTLKTAAGAVVETFDAATSKLLSLVGNTLTVNPTADLAYGTNYFLALDVGSLKDKVGNSHLGTSEYDFTTLRDTVAPLVTQWSPTDGAGNVAPSANVVLTFNEAMGRGTGTITLKTAAGVVVETFDATSSERITIAGNTVTINPTADLGYNTQYYLVLPTTVLQDTAGNAYKGNSLYDFRTASDTVAPVVTKFGTPDGVATIARDANISVAFSEAIARGAGTLSLKTAAGVVVETFNVATSPRLTIAGNTLTINPSADLASATSYSLGLPTGTFKDLAGNSLLAKSLLIGTLAAEVTLVGTDGSGAGGTA